MNSSLKIMDQQTDSMLKKLKTGFIVRWGHVGFSDFIMESIELINLDIHLFEENNENYVQKTQRDKILYNLNAVLNDTKNLLMLKPISEEVNDFINDFLILINNWNQISTIEELSQDIETIIRIISTQNTMEGLIERSTRVMDSLQSMVDKLVNQNALYSFSTSSTYLQAIKDSLSNKVSTFNVSADKYEEAQKCE